jgi:hypothetical protein
MGLFLQQRLAALGMESVSGPDKAGQLSDLLDVKWKAENLSEAVKQLTNRLASLTNETVHRFRTHCRITVWFALLDISLRQGKIVPERGEETRLSRPLPLPGRAVTDSWQICFFSRHSE